jgi:hypothetical protein
VESACAMTLISRLDAASYLIFKEHDKPQPSAVSYQHFKKASTKLEARNKFKS